MKFIEVTDKIYKDPNIAVFVCGEGWQPASPEPLEPNLKERVLHWWGYHFTFGQPYCVVCLKEGIPTATDIAQMVAAAGSNKVSLKTDNNFTGTYWISANDLYFRITGRHLNADFEHGIVPRNAMMDEQASK
jgi:hypothetical protein